VIVLCIVLVAYVHVSRYFNCKVFRYILIILHLGVRGSLCNFDYLTVNAYKTPKEHDKQKPFSPDKLCKI
jgi:hypothetical protein